MKTTTFSYEIQRTPRSRIDFPYTVFVYRPGSAVPSACNRTSTKIGARRWALRKIRDLKRRGAPRSVVERREIA